MTILKTFKIAQEFSSVANLYEHLAQNIERISDLIEIKIQENSLQEEMFCLVGKEQVTEKNILFFASKKDFPNNLGELIFFAGMFEIDIVVFLATEPTKACLTSFRWLQSICNPDTEFILGEVRIHDYRLPRR
ncbi:MAG: hypothetical protein PHC64_10550 [Candidatus Gastranaerophilales bacterium]|nr:hypothetical protein [Candidatus Gastranaerophilales bacterium]